MSFGIIAISPFFIKVDFSKWKGVPGDDPVQTRLCRADYHGAVVKVTRSNNASVVGLEGLVAMETRNTFRILGKDNVLKTVPKFQTSFTFKVDEHVFTVGGSNMMMKPSDRAVKKWKNKGKHLAIARGIKYRLSNKDYKKKEEKDKF